jgi:hypothetical protein
MLAKLRLASVAGDWELASLLCVGGWAMLL